MPLLLINWEIFWDFGKVIWKILSTFQNVPLLTLNNGCHLAGCFSKFPAKIFLPSLTLNKGCLLWGCFRENSQIFFYQNAKRGAAYGFLRRLRLSIYYSFFSSYPNILAIAVRNIYCGVVITYFSKKLDTFEQPIQATLQGYA